MKNAKIYLEGTEVQFMVNVAAQENTTWEKFVTNDENDLSFLTSLSKIANHLKLQMVVNQVTAFLLDSGDLVEMPESVNVEYDMDRYINELTFSCKGEKISIKTYIIGHDSDEDSEDEDPVIGLIDSMQDLLDNSINSSCVIDPAVVAKYLK